MSYKIWGAQNNSAPFDLEAQFWSFSPNFLLTGPFLLLWRAIATKAPLRVQFLLTFFGGRGEEQEASALLIKKGGREGSIESQQKFDIFSYDCMPNLA